jgi:hypothetical protein
LGDKRIGISFNVKSVASVSLVLVEGKVSRAWYLGDGGKVNVLNAAQPWSLWSSYR